MQSTHNSTWINDNLSAHVIYWIFNLIDTILKIIYLYLPIPHTWIWMWIEMKVSMIILHLVFIPWDHHIYDRRLIHTLYATFWTFLSKNILQHILLLIKVFLSKPNSECMNSTEVLSTINFLIFKHSSLYGAKFDLFIILETLSELALRTFAFFHINQTNLLLFG